MGAADSKRERRVCKRVWVRREGRGLWEELVWAGGSGTWEDG